MGPPPPSLEKFPNIGSVKHSSIQAKYFELNYIEYDTVRTLTFRCYHQLKELNST